ncbi:hypothetical protein MASR1M45_03900 [Candidatus Kapaibacterium sp.]
MKPLAFLIIFFINICSLHPQFQWNQVRKGYPNLESLRDIKCVDSNDCYCLGTFDGYASLLRTSNGGNNWKSAFWDGEYPNSSQSKLYHAYRIAFPSKNIVYLAFEAGLLLKTSDNFNTWDSIIIKPSKIDNKNYSKDIRFLCMKDSNFGIAGSNSFLTITNDGWKTYRDINGLEEIVPEGYLLSFGLTYGNQVFIVDSLNFYFFINCAKQISAFEFIRRTGIVNTTDGGASWKFFELSNTKTNSDLYKYLLQFYFINHTLGFAIIEDSFDRSYIYKTTDGGLTWSTKFEDELGKSTELLEIAFSDEMNGIAVGKYGEVRVTYDGGETWVNETFAKDYDTRMDRIVQHVSYKNKTAFISTFADGIWKGTFPTTSIDENNSNGVYIYPNPASDYINITLPENMYSNPTLKHGVDNVVENVQIFNMLGVEVINSVSYAATPQDGNVRIEISHLPAGVYYVRIIGSYGSSSIVEKFVKM